jgi:hypothetical protein
MTILAPARLVTVLSDNDGLLPTTTGTGVADGGDPELSVLPVSAVGVAVSSAAFVAVGESGSDVAVSDATGAMSPG